MVSVTLFPLHPREGKQEPGSKEAAKNLGFCFCVEG